MEKTYRVPLRLIPQVEGGYTITSPLLPELITEGDTLEEALANVNDALRAVVEIYEDLQRPLPPELCLSSPQVTIEFETLLTVP